MALRVAILSSAFYSLFSSASVRERDAFPAGKSANELQSSFSSLAVLQRSTAPRNLARACRDARAHACVHLCALFSPPLARAYASRHVQTDSKLHSLAARARYEIHVCRRICNVL